MNVEKGGDIRDHWSTRRERERKRKKIDIEESKRRGRKNHY